MFRIMAGELFQRIDSLFARLPKPVLYTFAALGFLSFSRSLLTPLHDFYRYHLQPSPNYVTRYGKGAYALITGASDGIGEELAYAFARDGFNLVLIGRNPEKLDKVKAKCVLTHCVHVVEIVQDLNTLDSAVYTKIAAQIEPLDLAIVVNNAAAFTRGPFNEQSQEDIMAQITVNVVAHTLLTRAVLPKLLSRGRKGLIINMSSIAARMPVGYLAIYCATKAYIRAFSLALAEELKGKIDVFAACPASVSTKMTGYPKINSEVTTLAVTVQGLLSQAVRETESFCSFKHSWLYYKVSFLSLAQRVSMRTAMAKKRYEACKAEAKK